MFTYQTGNVATIAAWFTAFESFIQQAGWTIVSGSGTTDLVIKSTGEDGLFTKLYARVWQNVNNVNAEVRNDAVGTHQTASGAYVAKGAGNFTYHINADKDAFCIEFRTAANTSRMMYMGTVLPFANIVDISDETKYMVAISNISASPGGQILQNEAGVWAHNVDVTFHPRATQITKDTIDNSFTLFGAYVDTSTTIAGELKNITSRNYGIGGVIAYNDTIHTGRNPDAKLTDWIVLEDNFPRVWAMRTGGVYPTGVDYDTDKLSIDIFTAYTSRDIVDNHLLPLMAAAGWTATDHSGVSGIDRDYIFYSRGRSGTDDIYIRWSHAHVNSGQEPLIYAQDDAVGTHSISAVIALLNGNNMPFPIGLIADKDCLIVLNFLQGGWGMGAPSVWWVGRGISFCPACFTANTPYSMIIQDGYNQRHQKLRDHDGTWAPATSTSGIIATGTDLNPNAYDGMTFVIWPVYAYTSNKWIHSQIRNVYSINNLAVCAADRLYIGDKEYIILCGYNGATLTYHYYALRIT